MEFRGFEKFLQGRNIEEVPRIVPRICGICDVQHHLAAAKAVDQIFGFKDDEILPAAYKMRELMNWGSYMHSHALHFYFLAAPDLIIPNGTRKTRNVFQVIKDMPEIALQAINIRRNGLEIVRKIGGRPIHPTSSTPGGISTELDDETQKELLGRAKENIDLAQKTLELAIPIFEENIDLKILFTASGDTECNKSRVRLGDLTPRVKRVDGKSPVRSTALQRVVLYGRAASSQKPSAGDSKPLLRRGLSLHDTCQRLTSFAGLGVHCQPEQKEQAPACRSFLAGRLCIRRTSALLRRWRSLKSSVTSLTFLRREPQTPGMKTLSG